MLHSFLIGGRGFQDSVAPSREECLVSSSGGFGCPVAGVVASSTGSPRSSRRPSGDSRREESSMDHRSSSPDPSIAVAISSVTGCIVGSTVTVSPPSACIAASHLTQGSVCVETLFLSHVPNSFYFSSFRHPRVVSLRPHLRTSAMYLGQKYFCFTAWVK